MAFVNLDSKALSSVSPHGVFVDNDINELLLSIDRLSDIKQNRGNIVGKLSSYARKNLSYPGALDLRNIELPKGSSKSAPTHLLITPKTDGKIEIFSLREKRNTDTLRHRDRRSIDLNGTPLIAKSGSQEYNLRTESSKSPSKQSAKKWNAKVFKPTQSEKKSWNSLVFNPNDAKTDSNAANNDESSLKEIVFDNSNVAPTTGDTPRTANSVDSINNPFDTDGKAAANSLGAYSANGKTAQEPHLFNRFAKELVDDMTMFFEKKPEILVFDPSDTKIDSATIKKLNLSSRNTVREWVVNDKQQLVVALNQPVKHAILTNYEPGMENWNQKKIKTYLDDLGGKDKKGGRKIYAAGELKNPSGSAGVSAARGVDLVFTNRSGHYVPELNDILDFGEPKLAEFFSICNTHENIFKSLTSIEAFTNNMFN